VKENEESFGIFDSFKFSFQNGIIKKNYLFDRQVLKAAPPVLGYQVLQLSKKN